MAMKVLEVCKVAPPLDSPTEMYLPLTFFDLLVLVVSPIKHLFFYEDPLLSSSTLVPKLKHTLSLTLKHFLPFSGNIVWPSSSSKPVFRYKKGDGILFTVAESDADFYHVSSKKLRESKLLDSFGSSIVGSGSMLPLFAIKVTIFSNKGFCIGITNHPSASDGKSISLFLKTWASISKFGKATDIMPVFDRESISRQYAKLEESYIEVLRKVNGESIFKLPVLKSESQSPSSVRGTFLLPSFQVRKLKEFVSDRLTNYKYNIKNNTTSHHVSTFVVLYAYVVLCMVKAKTIANNMVRVIFYYDCRVRLQPPLSVNYIGNCIGECVTCFDKKELMERDGLMMIVNFISASIKGLENNEPLKGAQEWLPNLINDALDTESMEVFVSSSNRFGFHKLDFGWGTPLKTDIFEKGGVTFIEVDDDNSGKGIEVDLCLAKGEMEKFAYEFALGLNTTTLSAL